MDRPKSFQWTGEPQQDRHRTIPPHLDPDPVPVAVKRRKPARGWQRPQLPKFPQLPVFPAFRLPRIRFRYLFLAVLAFAILSATMVTLWISSLDIAKLALPAASPTQLMDLHGKAVAEISTVKNEPVPIDQIAMSMREAIVAVEDKRFYRHTGVDVPGILRALFRNAKSGETGQGGSTITQQLAKNVFLSDRKTLKRKLTEAAYAIKIESSYDKDTILAMYLNQIYFGEGQWGIQRAAQRYFGKDANNLTLAESALLAGLPKAPSRYSPYRNKQLAMERRNLVLGLMRQEGFISDSQYLAAAAEPIRLAGGKSRDNSLLGKYPSFADAVIDEAIDRYGITERELMAGNLRIYTTLDPEIQAAMEKTYRNDSLFPPSASGQMVQSGAVILNPHTGGIRGIVGQRGEHVFRGFNHATQLERQPGSAFKPIMVYAPALEKGYTSESLLQDNPLNINGYRPENSDHQYRGEVTLHDALVHSWNVPAVWLLNEIGISAGKKFAEKLGIPFAEEDRNLGMALGGLSTGVSPLQMAQAYSVFPSLGKMIPGHTILKITTTDGRVLAEGDPAPVQVTSAGNAYAMTEMLMDVVREGTGTKAALDGRPTAGKTGTTQLPDTAEFQGISGGSKDAWFVGYTPELVAAVWMGFDETDSKHYLTTSGGQYPAMVFKEMMTLALQGKPVFAFQDPLAGQPTPNHERKEHGKQEKGKLERNQKKQENYNRHERKKGERKGGRHD